MLFYLEARSTIKTIIQIVRLRKKMLEIFEQHGSHQLYIDPRGMGHVVAAGAVV